MEISEIEKLRGTENWNIWKFDVRNFLHVTEGAYEVRNGEIVKPTPLDEHATAIQQATYQLNL